MIFIKKPKENIDMKLVDDLVRAYFSYLKNLNEPLNYIEISELLRYSICQVLNLPTKGYSETIDKLSHNLQINLKSILDSYNLGNVSDDYKKGLLEACVHCMEMSRKRVLGVE